MDSFIKPNPRLLIKKSRRLIDATYPGPLKSYYFTGPPHSTQLTI